MKARYADPRTAAFTIIELLVVVSIIALLVGILLPAIGKAKEQAKYQRSAANLRNLGVAHATYTSGHNDRNLTFVTDSIAAYGINACQAFENYADQWGPVHPNLVLGYGRDYADFNQYVLWQYYLDGSTSHHCWGGNPIDLGASSPGFGQFRFGHQTRAFSPYLSGRYYDPVFWAPKEKILYEIVSPGFESPDQFWSIPADDGTSGQVLFTSSYCLSPAAMYSPDAFKYDEETGKAYTEPWSMPGGLRAPSGSQALYPALKTHMLEHSWLQNQLQPCNPGFDGPGTFEGCETYYFNHAWESQPVTLFFDGHVAQTGVRDTMRADGRHMVQTGYGLWSRDTPLGENGYFIDYGYDQAATSFHIFTTDGIRGRDVMSK